MNTLQLIDGGKNEPRVDTRLLAAELRNQHKAVMAMLDRYEAKFKGFGVLPFQMEQPQGAKGGRPERFALLNEDQAFFLLSLSRNTDHVVDLKAKLVTAFKEARAGKEVISIEYLPGYRALHERAHQLSVHASNERNVHMNFNKLLNKTAAIEPGTRAELPSSKMALLIVAHEVAVRAMESANDHHDGYQKAKAALSSLSQAVIVKP